MPRKAQPAFLRRWPGTARWPLPGDGLSHPEQKCKQRIKPSASFGSSVTLDFTEILQDALENFPFFRYDRDNTMERWGKTQKWEKPLSLPFFHPQKARICPWLFAPITRPVCAAVVHPSPWENWKKRPFCFSQTRIQWMGASIRKQGVLLCCTRS